jgi:hypothetical protein
MSSGTNRGTDVWWPGCLWSASPTYLVLVGRWWLNIHYGLQSHGRLAPHRLLECIRMVDRRARGTAVDRF